MVSTQVCVLVNIFYYLVNLFYLFYYSWPLWELTTNKCMLLFQNSKIPSTVKCGTFPLMLIFSHWIHTALTCSVPTLMEIPFDLSQPGLADSLTERSDPPVQWTNETASDVNRLPTMYLSTKYSSTVYFTSIFEGPVKLILYDPLAIDYG